MFNNEMFQCYLSFVGERHAVWEERQIGAPAPWTSDPILASRKFTNVFRVLDPGSQFIFKIRDVDPATTLMRLFLYRHTGRVDAWMYLNGMMDLRLPRLETLDWVHRIWQDWRSQGQALFTGAYLVYPQSSSPGTDKLDSIIRLTQRLFGEEGLAEEFLQAPTMEARFKTLRQHKGVADFMSMQILTDWGYLYPQDENEFVVPGPGCRKGVAHVTDTRDVVGFLRFAQAEVHASPDCPTLDLDSGPRPPSLMDIQNTWCEFGKYVRYLKAYKVSPPYTPAHPGKQEPPVLPAHWSATTR